MQDPSLVQFQGHLCDGPKGDKTTLEATVDTSRYLKYACGPSITPHWERLSDRDLFGKAKVVQRDGWGNWTSYP